MRRADRIREVLNLISKYYYKTQQDLGDQIIFIHQIDQWITDNWYDDDVFIHLVDIGATRDFNGAIKRFYGELKNQGYFR